MEDETVIEQPRRRFKIRTVGYIPNTPLAEEDEITIDFDEDIEELEEPWSPKKEIDNLTNKRSNRDSTITSQEKRAFHRIFLDIFQRSPRANSPDHLSSQAELQRNEEKAHSTTHAEVKTTSLNQYPPSLRAAAAEAMGVVLEKTGEVTGADQAPINSSEISEEEQEALREPERRRIESLMTEATTDFQLWEVMDKEVFSLIQKMGLSDVPQGAQDAGDEKRSRVKNKKKKGKSKQLVQPEEGKGKPEPTPAVITSKKKLKEKSKEEIAKLLSLYGPLYPSFLLFGLRLMDRSFTKSSPLALAILPKIKSLGFISHVLGASTQFYNELLQIYRYQYDDFQGMLTLLNEMEAAALEFDEETYQIVVGVIRLQKAIYRGDKGTALQNLWRFPEFSQGKFRPWSQKIASSLREREAEKIRLG